MDVGEEKARMEEKKRERGEGGKRQAELSQVCVSSVLGSSYHRSQKSVPVSG